MRVLLVDDEREFVSALSERLRLRGLDADFYSSAVDAVEAFRVDSDYNVIVLDLKMPDMDALTTFKSFKEINPSVEIIILSGLIEDNSEISLIKKSAMSFLYKPVDIKELIGKITEAHSKTH